MRDKLDTPSFFTSQENMVTPENMNIMVLALLQKAKQGLKSFNPIILSLKKNNYDSLAHFLKLLHYRKNTISPKTRFQVIYSIGGHWSVMDIHVNEHNKLELFMFDAANAMNHMIPTMMLITEHCPGSNLFYSGPTIQKDPESCAFFALDNAKVLATIPDLHKKLPKCVETGKMGCSELTYSEYLEYIVKKDKQSFSGIQISKLMDSAKHVQYIPGNKLLPEFGGLLKNIQSYRMYDNFFSKVEYIRGGNKRPLEKGGTIWGHRIFETVPFPRGPTYASISSMICV